jgi:microcystin-dependent protein
MSTPFIGQIDMFGGNFAPTSYAFCNGQQMSIAQNQALFSLLGTTYGGNGTTTFDLPNLVTRIPVHFGTGPGLSQYQLGQSGGVTDVTLSVNQIPMHNHALNAAKVTAQTPDIAGGSLPAQPGAGSAPELYASGAGMTQHTFAAASVSPAGSGFPHANMMPSQCISFIIALQGIFPSRS